MTVRTATIRKDLTGQRFSRWVVLSFAGRKRLPGGSHAYYWLCRCDCGTVKDVNRAYLKNGHSKSCGCYQRDINRLKKGEAAARKLYRHYKDNATTRGLVFQLSYVHFLQLTKQNCFYCGVGPEQIMQPPNTYGHYLYNGIDRIDNNKGYELSNVVACCGTCNLMKRTATQQEFLDQVAKISRHQVNES